MLLVFDIGNSNIVLGTYEGKKLLKHWRISTDRQKTGDEYGMLMNNLFAYQGIQMKDIDAIIISSVVPPLVVPMIKMCERYFHIKPLVVGPGIRTGIRLHYENPRAIGADRIVNVVGAYEAYGGPLIVIDIGTATTFDVVDTNGDFLGGVISVGIEMAFRALSSGTAALPLISGGNVAHAIGTNTTDSMRSGVVIGMASMMDGFIERFTSEMGSVKSVVATGGYSPLVIPYCKHEMIYDSDLLLKGMLAIYKKNR